MQFTVRQIHDNMHIKFYKYFVDYDVCGKTMHLQWGRNTRKIEISDFISGSTPYPNTIH